MKLCGSWGITIGLLLLSCCSLWLVQCVGVGDDDGQYQTQDQDQDKNQLREKALETHNGLRALHSAVPLTWDHELEASARRVADSLIKSRRLTSSGTLDVGENVAGFKAPQKGSYEIESESEEESESQSESELKDDEIAFNCIMDWYSEGENFDWTNPDKNWMNGVAHFSQIVWNSTRSFGMVVVTEPPPTAIIQENNNNNNNNSTRISKISLAKVIVAHYKPPGNILGEFAVNVFPKIEDSNIKQNQKQTTTTKENSDIEKGDLKQSGQHDQINKNEKEL